MLDLIGSGIRVLHRSAACHAAHKWHVAAHAAAPLSLFCRPEPQADSSCAHCAGNPVNALGQAIAQQQFNALVDLCTYEELYAFFGGAGCALRAATHVAPLSQHQDACSPELVSVW